MVWAAASLALAEDAVKDTKTRTLAKARAPAMDTKEPKARALANKKKEPKARAPAKELKARAPVEDPKARRDPKAWASAW